MGSSTISMPQQERPCFFCRSLHPEQSLKALVTSYVKYSVEGPKFRAPILLAIDPGFNPVDLADGHPVEPALTSLVPGRVAPVGVLYADVEGLMTRQWSSVKELYHRAMGKPSRSRTPGIRIQYTVVWRWTGGSAVHSRRYENMMLTFAMKEISALTCQVHHSSLSSKVYTATGKQAACVKLDFKDMLELRGLFCLQTDRDQRHFKEGCPCAKSFESQYSLLARLPCCRPCTKLDIYEPHRMQLSALEGPVVGRCPVSVGFLC